MKKATFLKLLLAANILLATTILGYACDKFDPKLTQGFRNDFNEATDEAGGVPAQEQLPLFERVSSENLLEITHPHRCSPFGVVDGEFMPAQAYFEWTFKNPPALLQAVILTEPPIVENNAIVNTDKVIWAWQSRNKSNTVSWEDGYEVDNTGRPTAQKVKPLKEQYLNKYLWFVVWAVGLDGFPLMSSEDRAICFGEGLECGTVDNPMGANPSQISKWRRIYCRCDPNDVTDPRTRSVGGSICDDIIGEKCDKDMTPAIMCLKEFCKDTVKNNPQNYELVKDRCEKGGDYGPAKVFDCANKTVLTELECAARYFECDEKTGSVTKEQSEIISRCVESGGVEKYEADLDAGLFDDAGEEDAGETDVDDDDDPPEDAGEEDSGEEDDAGEEDSGEEDTGANGGGIEDPEKNCSLDVGAEPTTINANGTDTSIISIKAACNAQGFQTEVYCSTTIGEFVEFDRKVGSVQTDETGVAPQLTLKADTLPGTAVVICSMKVEDTMGKEIEIKGRADIEMVNPDF